MAETHKQLLQAANSAISKFEVNHLISEGDWLTALGEITSKDDEGNEVRYAYCDVWRFEGDKLARVQTLSDTAVIAEALES